MNFFSWLLGSPSDAAADAAYNKGVKDLKAARLRGDKAAEQAALDAMRKAAKQSQATAQKGVNNVEAVEKTATTIKQGFKIGGGLIAGVGLVLLVLILKK